MTTALSNFKNAIFEVNFSPLFLLNYFSKTKTILYQQEINFSKKYGFYPDENEKLVLKTLLNENKLTDNDWAKLGFSTITTLFNGKNYVDFKNSYERRCSKRTVRKSIEMANKATAGKSPYSHYRYLPGDFQYRYTPSTRNSKERYDRIYDFHHEFPLGMGGLDSPLNGAMIELNLHKLIHIDNNMQIYKYITQENGDFELISEEKFPIKFRVFADPGTVFMSGKKVIISEKKKLLLSNSKKPEDCLFTESGLKIIENIIDIREAPSPEILSFEDLKLVNSRVNYLTTDNFIPMEPISNIIENESLNLISEMGVM